MEYQHGPVRGERTWAPISQKGPAPAGTVHDMEQVQILWVSRSVSPPGAGIKRHDHPYYHLFYVTGGTLDMTVGKEQFCIEAGHGIIVPKETLHGYYVRGEREAEYMEVKFILNNSPALDAQLTQLDPELFEDPTAGALIGRLVEEYGLAGISIWTADRMWRPIYALIESMFSVEKII